MANNKALWEQRVMDENGEMQFWKAQFRRSQLTPTILEKIQKMREEPHVDNREKNLPGREKSMHEGPNMTGKFYKQQEVLLLGWGK